MIRVQNIHIEEFRGIRALDLNIDGKNFGICGPNGTGKSGIVDAIEFCLTGDVTRLSGQGTTGLSVKQHAPHVDQRGHPENAFVTITATAPSIGKTITIKRSVKNPKHVQITPSEPKTKRLAADLALHPEFALSRREIIKYIITPPGRRSEDVQTLLRLDHLEKLRKSFTTLSNSCKREAESAEREHRQAEVDLKTALKIETLDRALVLDKVNERRQLLGLSILEELTREISFKADLTTPPKDDKGHRIRKVSALTDIEAFQTAIDAGEPEALIQDRKLSIEELEKLRHDEQALALARRHGFIQQGLELIIDDSCPLCDTPWSADELRAHLNKKILSAEEIDNALQKLKTNLNGILSSLSLRLSGLNRIIEYCQALEPAVKHVELTEHAEQLRRLDAAISDFLKDHTLLVPVIERITDSWWALPTGAKNCFDECLAAVNGLPETSAEDDARDFLIVAQERYERILRTSKEAKDKKVRDKVAKKVLELYNDKVVNVLEGIYDSVADDFSNFYRSINHEDEDGFVGKLKSEPAKLSFDVDFYGRGLFPPGAYHSEGHQDGMGLCLYLALMKHTLGNNFAFAVLDDVLMSVDTGHRREVCRLLRKQFPKTQFILTTHDRVWLQFMKTEQLIERSQSFGGWTVDSGPRVWDDYDIWTEIQTELDRNDVAKAAWLLRRYLEYISNILADNLRAPVEFRSDGHYDLGDLLPNVLSQWKKRLEEGERSAEHWGLDDEKKAISVKRAEVKKAIAKSYAEQWAINPSVHFNEWANLQSHEFREVADAFKGLLEQLRCSNTNCGAYIYVLPRKGRIEELRCNCGSVSINLKTKP